MHLPLFGRPRHAEIEKLYAELAPALLAYSRSLGLDHAIAEDVVHRIFLALLERKVRPDDPRPYLFRAVRNTSLNYFRDRSRDVDLPDDEPWFKAETVDCTAQLDLGRALRELQEDQRDVVMMHLWGGLTFQEVATALDISANTAASRYRYALLALKQVLTPRPQAQEHE
jgi:RNA polymerase sigma-70 factor (ECF subfamily)